MQGIYVIICWANHKLYVGSTNDLEKRRKKHWADAKQDKHHNIHFQRAWGKYGPEAFEFRVLLEMPDVNHKELLDAESVCDHLLAPTFNIRDPRLTPAADLAVAAKIGVAMMGNRYGEANKGRTLNEEWKAKLSVAAKDRKASPETRAKMSASHKTSEVAKVQQAKLHEANKGRIHTLEARAKISKALMGNRSFTGRRHTIATRVKMSQSQHLRFARDRDSD